MDKRSFIRGFGTGVLFASLILGVSCLLRTSDASVIRRAKKLGMQYPQEQTQSLFPDSVTASQSAADAEVKTQGQTADAKETKAPAVQTPAEKQKTNQPRSTQKPTNKPKTTDQVTMQPKATAKTDKSATSDSKGKDELTKEKEQAKKEFAAKEKEFTIKAGEWSDQVSKNLAASDIISDAKAFDRYMNEHGYSDNIKAGTFKIPSDATFDEIARAITK